VLRLWNEEVLRRDQRAGALGRIATALGIG
jgi:hypothetical protein